MQEISFRPFSNKDTETCLAIFDANCPTYFAPNERADYEDFLATSPPEYEVCEVSERVVAAFGLITGERSSVSLNWIMLDPRSQGIGLGSAIMERVISQGRALDVPLVKIAASHKSAPFFTKFGAVAKVHTKDGWGPGMDRIDMELDL